MPFKSYSVFLLYIILFHALNVICLINKNIFFITNPPKSISHFSRVKSKDIRFKKNIYVKIPFRGIRQKLLLFDKLKNGLFFFKYIQHGKNEVKYVVAMHIYIYIYMYIFLVILHNFGVL